LLRSQFSEPLARSAQALIEAKSELLALQKDNRAKDAQVTALQETIQNRDGTLRQLIPGYEDAVETALKLQQQAEAMSQAQAESDQQLGMLTYLPKSWFSFKDMRF